MRLTLNYYDHDGDFRTNKELEDLTKGLGFRWFQLSNYSDGRRGQQVNAKRSEDQKEPETENELFLRPSRMAVCPVDEEEEDED